MPEIVLYFGHYKHHVERINDFAAGLRRHKQPYRIKDCYWLKDADLFVFWSAAWHHLIERQLLLGRDFLIIENGYIERKKHRSLGYQNINGRAQFYNKGVPSDRGDKFRHLLEPKKEGTYALIIGQVQKDMQVRHRINVADWADRVYDSIRDKYEHVYFRPHPLDQDVRPQRCPIEPRPVEGASAVYTYSSNTGVEAILKGVPACGLDKGSMIHSICPDEPRLPDDEERNRWLDEISYAQWTDKEIRNGDAWDHLKQRYD